MNAIFPYPLSRFGLLAALGLLCLTFGTAFFPRQAPAPTKVDGSCSGRSDFAGYTFVYPEIINKNAAYAPFFLRWNTYYDQVYFNQDLQRLENIQEWKGRFCTQPEEADIEYIVYKSTFGELSDLRLAAGDQTHKTTLPYSLAGNTFAEMIALNGCVEVVDYLMFAKKCEPYVLPQQNAWQETPRDTAAMQRLIREGVARFKDTESHFIKLRYTYQIVRMAHYARRYQQTIDLYNFLMPKVDRKKPSIVFFWTLGHLAGALQKLGKYPEAAYRYAIVFRYCPSKREQAYRSFIIRNDQDWAQALALCQNDAEKSTLHLMRAGGAGTGTLADMQAVYELDAENPQLALLLVGTVQEMEKTFLRTPVTDVKYGVAQSAQKRKESARHLLDLQKFVRRVVNDKQIPNLPLWRAVGGYLALLAGDRYAAEQTFKRVERQLEADDEADRALFKQIAAWRILIDIFNIDPATKFPDDAAFRIRSYDAFKANPDFEAFLQDWLSAAYAAQNRPGKAILAGYEPSALGLNPRLDELDDLLQEAAKENPVFLEKAMMIDTNPDLLKARLLEWKGVCLFGMGQPEAALATLRQIAPTQENEMAKFSPFREIFTEIIGRPVTDSLLLTREQIVEKILQYEFQAKAASAEDKGVAAWYYYLIGLAYYNMSYFGYEWEAMDFYRSGYNWNRLAQGPVFPLAGSPQGNRENTDVGMALAYFEKALSEAKNPELAARAVFMAARCQQKQWFCSPECRYKPGSRLIPVIPKPYDTYYNVLIRQFSNTAFYEDRIKECKWLAAYAR